MNPILSHTEITAGPAPERWLYVLHGIYGSGRNWATVAKRLVEEHPGWGAILVDLRLHGDSLGFAPPHTLEACARDVARLEAHLDRPAKAILGHSFGGKVALLRAADPAERLAQVWVIDSTLRTGEPTGSAWRIVELVEALPETFRSRQEVAEALTRHGYAPGVGQWLAMNLEREGDSFRWKLDWEGVEAMLRDYFARDVWGIVENPPEGTELHIVKASQSDALDSGTTERIERAVEATGAVHLHRVEGSHWLNVDNPDAILELLTTHLPD